MEWRYPDGTITEALIPFSPNELRTSNAGSYTCTAKFPSDGKLISREVPFYVQSKSKCQACMAYSGINKEHNNCYLIYGTIILRRLQVDAVNEECNNILL